MLSEWCITTNGFVGTEKMYLGWQKPAWDEDGYFWTNKKTLMEIVHLYNTTDHPFIFSSRTKAIKHLKTLNIPQKCKAERLQQA